MTYFCFVARRFSMVSSADNTLFCVKIKKISYAFRCVGGLFRFEIHKILTVYSLYLVFCEHHERFDMFGRREHIVGTDKIDRIVFCQNR